MAANKLDVGVLLIVLGVIFIGAKSVNSAACLPPIVGIPRHCPAGAYLRCPGESPRAAQSSSCCLPRACKCCLVPENCSLYLQNGTKVDCPLQ
ncbi:hypothetical protein Nepgr_002177 [Nepenthes gracilis]|uniref:Uncharacterized protein n=1 Tax=Nepenthes gracilis TaxID=150966 RepID=A0AAD3P8G6_NEPGR|nr:hypothetical protein Nepgr_002177 [Nepenthes gracilis]